MEKNLYNLNLHEGLTTDFGIFIMRVPGGWIYDCWDAEKDCYKSGTFVPYNDDFMQTVEYNPNTTIGTVNP